MLEKQRRDAFYLREIILYKQGEPMEKDPIDKDIPLGQRLYDRPFLLLIAGLVVMFGFYTIWGLFEVLSLPQAELP